MLRHLLDFLSLRVIVGPFPFTIANGQPIDAVPVMADFNWLRDQVNTNVGSAITNVGPTAFTPTMMFGGSSTGVTYTTRTGFSYKLGNMLFWSIYILLSSKGSSSGFATVGGLPSAVSASWSDIAIQCPIFSVHISYTGTNLVGYMQPGHTDIALVQCASFPTAPTELTDANFQNDAQFSLSGFYAY